VTLADPAADPATLRAACEEALALGGHQERLVQAMLALASSERGATRWDPVDLAQVAGRALASTTENNLDVRTDLAPAVTTGDPRLIESLVTNLVDNAVRHNHAGGHVTVTTGTAGPHATLTVTNSGPVIPAEQVPRLLQPLQKHDGHGFGLAIVDAVARAHHATLTLDARPEGGLAVTVRFAQPGTQRYSTSGRPALP
jgi:signal transduction histidine kinase